MTGLPALCGGNYAIIASYASTEVAVTHFQPRKILGKWQEGFALDLHTLSSVLLGYDEFGHKQFETTRSEVGELLLRLKYRGDISTLPALTDAAVNLLTRWKTGADIIVPVPPSGARAPQPVLLLAQSISGKTGIPLVQCVTKTRDTPQLKNIFDLDERLAALEGVHAVDATATAGRHVLLFDDLFRSGATMNAITTALYEQGKAAAVFALTITRTRSHQ